MKANEYIAKTLTVIDNLDKNGYYIPALFMSHAGLGKTSTIQKWCDFKGYKLVTLVPSTCSSDDILGVPCVKGQITNNEELVRLTPSWYTRLMKLSDNEKNRVVLFLDEISATDSYLQAPLFNLIFNRDLGDCRLPDNCLVISAGNYSEDLNGEFNMTSPLVNRFMILNLQNEDVDLIEVLERRFEKVKTKEEIEEFFGLNEYPNNIQFDFNMFKEWSISKNEITMGRNHHSEEEGFGLLGFTSPRSYDYSMKFAESFIETYPSNPLWMRLVGDTLGVSAKREGKPLRSVFESYTDRFTRIISKMSFEENRTIEDVCKEVLEKGVTPERIRILERLINSKSFDDITSKELNSLTAMMSENYQNPSIQYLSRLINSKGNL